MSLLRGGAVLLILSSCGSGAKTTPPSGFAPGTCSTGPGSININTFNENPLTGSGNGSLPFNSTLTTSMTRLSVLSGLVGNCLLQSDRYTVPTDTFFPNNIALTNSSSVLYAPTAPEFQQLNSFFYATELRNLVTNTLGFPLSGRVSIDAHCNQADNAFFSPSSKALCFGFHNVGGGKKVWAADDADVVVHEAGHSVNHNLASTSILGSTEEAGAIDESIADYWALTVLNDGQLAEWFLGAIGSSLIRDATISLSYPGNLDFEIHDDSRMLTEVLFDLRGAGNLGKADTDKLVKRALQLLPATARFTDFYEAFYTASGPSFLNLDNTKRALIVSKFTAKGIHRVDSAAGLRLSTTGSATVKVIDDHSYSFQSGGNCNGTLDVGETALVLVNLENVNATAMGNGIATLGATPAGITIPSGGNIGEYFRLSASSDFIASLPPGGSTRQNAVATAAFLIHATTAGAKSFSLTFKPMYSDATGTVPANADVTVNFSLTVGSTATSTSCTNLALWP